jgi:hypothetical protein
MCATEKLNSQITTFDIFFNIQIRQSAPASQYLVFLTHFLIFYEL